MNEINEFDTYRKRISDRLEKEEREKLINGGVMKSYNGKVWIENTDGNITDVSQLDFKIYKLIRKLLDNGAIIEIGPAKNIDSKVASYLKGLYCTNLTKEQIMEIFNRPDKVEEDVIVEEKIEVDDDSNKNVKDIISEIQYASNGYYTAYGHGCMFQITIGDVLEDIINNFKNNTIPRIKKLPLDERKELFIYLCEINDDKTITYKAFYEEAIITITKLFLKESGPLALTKNQRANVEQAFEYLRYNGSLDVLDKLDEKEKVGLLKKLVNSLSDNRISPKRFLKEIIAKISHIIYVDTNKELESENPVKGSK